MAPAPRSVLYFAVLINEVTVDGPGHVPTYEESVVLVRATSDDDAERIARDHARAAETSYLNEDGETVRWIFRELATLGPALEESIDDNRLPGGVEIFSRTFGDLEAYRTAHAGADAARWSPDLHYRQRLHHER